MRLIKNKYIIIMKIRCTKSLYRTRRPHMINTLFSLFSWKQIVGTFFELKCRKSVSNIGYKEANSTVIGFPLFFLQNTSWFFAAIFIDRTDSCAEHVSRLHCTIFRSEIFIISRDLPVSYTHLDVYKRQG